MITYSEYFKRIAEGETAEAIAESIGINRSTIQSALRRAGYVAEGNGNYRKWVYKGEAPEPLDEPLRVRERGKGKHNASISESTKKANTSMNESAKKVDNSKTKASKKLVASDSDKIDLLLSNKPKKERTYRGFYFDNDVLSIIEGVASGNKSDLVNEVLRKVFKEKGLL